MISGKIMKALSGFYYVQTDDGLIECKARGRFRKEGLTPLVGDLVEISVENGKGMLETICPRTNSFVRPAVANLDMLVLLVSEAIPVTEPFLIDRITAIAGDQNVPVVICVNKSDLEPGTTLRDIYTKAGYEVAREGDGINLAYPDSETRRGRVGKGCSQTLDCSGQMGPLIRGGRIRRLTPRECFRLQGFSDELFDRASAVNSDAQLYKQAGNAVTATVAYAVAMSLPESRS